jgi:hypothetical protein
LVEFTRCRPSRRGDVGEQIDQASDCLLVAFDRGPLVIIKRDLDQHPLGANVAGQSWALVLERLPAGCR